jgi:diketogulonate reductase-like aldo/keto reductase
MHLILDKSCQFLRRRVGLCFMSILQKQLGDTAIMISEIGIGTAQYRGGSELLRKAVELGATLIDTAERYENEAFVGQVIKGIRDQVFVATKTHHWRHKDILRCVDASLRRLNIDCIDLYQIHWPNAAVPIAETMSVMEDLVDSGKIRFIGLSNFSVPEMRQAQSALRKNKIVSNQMRYSIVDRSVETAVLPYCRKNHITLIAYSPLSSGFQNILNADPLDVLGKVARMANKTKAQVALNWCISKSVAIPKTDSYEHMIDNCGSSGWSLTEEQIALLDSGIRFRRRSRLEAWLRRRVRRSLQLLRIR